MTRIGTVASHWVAGSGAAVPSAVTSSSSTTPSSTSPSCSRSSATFASTCGDVQNSIVEISKPIGAKTATFAVAGGGEPVTGPMATRSGPTWVSCTVSRCTVASGLR